MAAGGGQCELGTVLAEHDDAGNTETEQAAGEEGDERAALYKEEVENVVNVEIDNTRVLPRFFQQRYFSEKFGSDFGKQACAATSLLNELSEQYTLNTGLQMTDEQADAAMQAAVNSGNVSDSDANVNNWAGAANAMWSTIGQRGSFVYGGDNPTAIIYAEDKDQNGKAEHFTNSNGSGTYYDPINENTGTVGDTPLQNEGLGNTRTLTYQSGEE